MHLKRRKISSLDKPWMTEQIKITNRKRQKAVNRWDKTLKWRKIRNKLQRLIKAAKKNYHKNEIQHLKNENPKDWLDFINKSLRRKKRSERKIKFDGVEQNNVANVLISYFAEA